MIPFVQALGLIGYCSLISLVFWRGEQWFGRVPNFLGPFLMLIILCTSALICGLIVFSCPVKLYLKTKKFDQPLQLVLSTAAWLVVFSLLIMLGISLWKR